ncbi:unnamed protein product, partial [Rhizoctonia solani]
APARAPAPAPARAAPATPAAKKPKGAGAKKGAAAGGDDAGGIAGTLKGLLGLRSVAKHVDFSDTNVKNTELEKRLIPSFSKRAFATPSQFADEDAKNAELENRLIASLQPVAPVEKKRVIRSRVVGSLSGYWI